MHIDPYIVLGSAVIGLLVGMTGAGGGALMTPMLILLFGVTPTAAISSDLVAAVVMRPFGAAVHLKARTVNLRLVRLMATGSVPAAFLGAYLLHLLGNSRSATHHIETILGVALLVGAGAMVLRFTLDRRAGEARMGVIHEIEPRPLITIAIGIVGGVIVGMTSVGSGSLMIVLLLFVYPTISAKQLVGTDLTQAVPLTLAGGGSTARVLEGATLFLAAGAYLAHMFAHHDDRRELLTRSILVSAFALWGIVQIAPSLPDNALLNDIVIVLFVTDLAILVSPWI